MKPPGAVAVLALISLAATYGADAAHQSAPAACEVTRTVTAPVVDRDGLPFPRGRWYVNAEQSIWAGIGWEGGALHAGGRGHSVLWIRPEGTNLSVTARRLDGESAPVRATIGDVAAGRYVPSSVHFPTSGCWEITATAGASRLTFVARVEPQDPDAALRAR